MENNKTISGYRIIRDITVKKLRESNSLIDKIKLENILRREKEYQEKIKKNRKSDNLTEEDKKHLEELINLWYERLMKSKNQK